MAYSNSSRFRSIDKLTNWYWPVERCSTDELINDPERYLLSQEDVFEAEGGYTGALLHFATVAGALGALFTARPALARYFMKGSLRFNEWALIAGTGILSYKLGYGIGYTVSGDIDKLTNHYTAYTLVKTNNRFEGRVNLMKKPGF